MNGWIKLEKDLLTDPRLLSMAHELSITLQYDDTQRSDGMPVQRCNGRPFPGVTVVLGALAQLWMIADTHIGLDDVLPLGVDEINHIIGVENICEIFPQNWLQIIDATHVKLPGYQAHNGPAAKERAQAHRRVQIHRAKRNGQALHIRNAQPLPDKDKDNIRTPKPPLPGVDLFAWDAWKKYRAEIHKPIKPSMEQAAMRKLLTHGSAQAAAVEHSIANGYIGLFAPPVNGHGPTVREVGKAAVRETAEWLELLASAEACGFRKPYTLESPEQYAEELRRFKNRAPPSAISHAIAGKLQ